jgi:hypothetical protein
MGASLTVPECEQPPDQSLAGMTGLPLKTRESGPGSIVDRGLGQVGLHGLSFSIWNLAILEKECWHVKNEML